jgi:hypothetical protein
VLENAVDFVKYVLKIVVGPLESREEAKLVKIHVGEVHIVEEKLVILLGF